MNKQEMIEAIYDKIADKTLSEWCNIINNRIKSKKKSKIVRIKYWWISFISCDSHSIYKEKMIWFDKYHKIIWHPVMTWDVLDYLYNNSSICSSKLYGEVLDRIVWRTTSDLWEDKRKPIENQSKECIIYVFNLIND